jgi:hypothetical protein
MWAPTSCGFDVLGCDAEIGFDVTDYLKKAGPELLSTAAEEIKSGDKKPEKKPEKKAEPSGGSWLTKPALGPLPGWGVLAGVGVLGLGGFFLLRK